MIVLPIIKSFQTGTITAGLALEIIKSEEGLVENRGKGWSAHLYMIWAGVSSESGAYEVGNLRCNKNGEVYSFLPPLSLFDVNPLKP